MNESLVQAIATRVLSLLDERMANRKASVKYDTSDSTVNNVNPEQVNGQEQLTVKADFTVENTNEAISYCTPQPYAIKSTRSTSNTVKDDTYFTATPADKSTVKQPTVNDPEDWEQDFALELEAITLFPLQEEQSEQTQAVLRTENTASKTHEEETEQDISFLKKERVSSIALDDDDFSESDGQHTETQSSDTIHLIDDVEQDELHPLTAAIKDTVKKDDVKYDWVEAAFLRRIEDHICAEFNDISPYLSSFGCRKVLECFTCILRNLIAFSNCPQVDYKTFCLLSGTLTRLVHTDYFEALPRRFPYRALILELEGKLSALAITHKGHNVIRFQLSVEKKVVLVATRFQLSQHIAEIKFRDVQGILP